MSFVLLAGSSHHLDLPSFPTRRSSDLLGARQLRHVAHELGGLKQHRTRVAVVGQQQVDHRRELQLAQVTGAVGERSEEHTSELQSPCNLVCRLLLEKKKDSANPSACFVGVVHVVRSVSRFFPPPGSTLFPYTTLFRSPRGAAAATRGARARWPETAPNAGCCRRSAAGRPPARAAAGSGNGRGR